MRFWKDKTTGYKMCEPDCADEWLQMIWAVGVDHDGCTSAQDLRQLVDELVEMSQRARVCLRDGRVFPDGGVKPPDSSVGSVKSMALDSWKKRNKTELWS